MTSVVIAVAAEYGEKNVKQIALSAVDKAGKKTLESRSFAVADGAMHEVFPEMDKWTAQWKGKVSFVVESAARVFKRDIPSMAKKHPALSVPAHWTKFSDLSREVERSCNNKCSGLLGIMLTVGLEPTPTTTVLEEATVIGDCVAKLLVKGNEFKRPLMAKEVPDKKLKTKKRKREDEQPQHEEQEEKEPEAPPVIPSMSVLRQSMFLSNMARTMPQSAFSAIKKQILKSSSISLKTGETTSTEWATVATAYSVANEATLKPMVFSVPSLTSVLEATAAFTDCEESDVLACFAEAESMPAANVMITTNDHLEKLLERLQKKPSSVITIDHESGKKSWKNIKTSLDGNIALPIPETDTDEPAQLESVVGIEEPGSVEQKVLNAFKTRDMSSAAKYFKEIVDGRQQVGKSFSVACYYLLANTVSDVEPPVGMCPGLLGFHVMLARLVMEIDMLHDVGSGSKKSVPTVYEVVKAILRAPLLPYKDPVEEQHRLNPNKKRVTKIKTVPPHAILQTAILSSVAKYFVDTQIDEIADLWGVRFVHGQSPSTDLHSVKYGKKHGIYAAAIEAAMVGRLDGMQLGLNIATLSHESHWECLKPHFGPFNKFLGRAKHAFTADKREGIIYISTVIGAAQQTPCESIPLSGKKQNMVRELSRNAVEEILQILPRGSRKALLSSIGVSISGWAKFNTRHNGLLGASLHGFLLKHPEAFIVSGRSVCRTDPKTTPEFETNLLKHGGREIGDEDAGSRNQKKRKRGSRQDRLHSVITDKYNRKAARKNSLRSAKIQKIPGFGKSKGKYKGRGTTPHFMK
eukprot:TRINITY_DN651_c0_g2_i1.p1 TRINITY_DN651_c0_g2~~TRINITY_DN651_c0_g2_i1.p1  ORF type:complete len:805 (+),score=138.81 TRINITY_DN651_c0_g2_i1:62-2476(+)